jgi:SARP family transcriptional regulator, regulator of embCAB operon
MTPSSPDSPPSVRAPVISWRGPDGAEARLDLAAAPAHVTIGRREDSGVPLPWDRQVSRLHARLERVGAEWTVRDDGLSTNGTWVNGERIRGSRRLLDGDTVRVGRTELVVRAASRPDSLPTHVATAGGAHGTTTAGARVVVHLCGELRLQIDGRRLEGELSGRMGRRLFGYLVLKHGRVVPRDELTDVLWPARRPSSPEAGLSVHFARLRRALGDSALVGRSEVRIDLGPDVWVDIEAAQHWRDAAQRKLADGLTTEAIGAARAAPTALLDQGLLPEFRDEAWVQVRQAEVGALVAELLELEAEAALALGGSEVSAAERAATRLIEREPYRDSGYRLLMRVHAARGNPAQATDVYEALRRLLLADLGIPPAPETRLLYQRLLDPTEAG